MKLLPPQRLQPHYYEGVEEALRGAFADFLFAPLWALIPEELVPAEFANAAPDTTPLLLALRRGTITYYGGLFRGDFDAATSKVLRALGAELDRRTGAYALPEWAVPPTVRLEAYQAARRAALVHDQILRQLDATRARLDAGEMPVVLDPSVPVQAIEDGFASAAEAVGIRKTIPAAQRRKIEADYAANIRPYVTEATAEYIDQVHAAVTANAAAGYRYEGLVDEIAHAQTISQGKAKFLASQETRLFMAGYREARFTEAGVWRYKWSTSHDVRVRPYAGKTKLAKYGDHRALDGEIFTYDQKAPAKFMSSKKPCNPGQDFGCRCADRAIIE